MPGWLRVYLRVAIQTAILAAMIAGTVRGYIVWRTPDPAQPPPSDKLVRTTAAFAGVWTLILGAMHIAAVKGARRGAGSESDYDLPQRRAIDLPITREAAFDALKRAVIRTDGMSIEQALPSTGRLVARSAMDWKGRVTLTAEVLPRSDGGSRVELTIGPGVLTVVDQGISFALAEDIERALRATTPTT